MIQINRGLTDDAFRRVFLGGQHLWLKCIGHLNELFVETARQRLRLHDGITLDDKALHLCVRRAGARQGEVHLVVPSGFRPASARGPRAHRSQNPPQFRAIAKTTLISILPYRSKAHSPLLQYHQPGTLPGLAGKPASIRAPTTSLHLLHLRAQKSRDKAT
jgi:hypothetical protein